MLSSDYMIHLADWHRDEAKLREIRSAVFIQEQGVPAELEWDGEDANAIHVLATASGGEGIGTGRLLMHGGLAHIGRMAVLPAWRGQGVGAALLHRLLDAASAGGAHKVFLNAQTYAVPFYERCHFLREGEEFLDAGIPHYRMTLALSR